MILHSPVMLQEILSFVPEGAKIIVDGTLGHGGHAIAMAEKFPDAKIIGLDVDEKMLAKAKLRVKSSVSRSLPRKAGLATPAELDGSSFTKEDTIECIYGSYADIDTILGDKKADFILLDLGVNLEHFLATERGFSLKGNAPLDMRFDQGGVRTAADVVNTYTLSDLQSLFVRYADFTESKAQELADTIVRERKKTRISTTFELKHVLGLCGLGNSAVAVIFQAIRIEVNGELANLGIFLKKFPLVLNSGGRCAILSYHSIEDRLVKQSFQVLADAGNYKLLTKKVIAPHYTEVAKNKAARSAKMRVLEKNE